MVQRAIGDANNNASESPAAPVPNRSRGYRSTVAPTTAILCPLQHEAPAARRAAGTLAQIVVCGPGADRTRAAVKRIASQGTTRIILFGTCAGLRALPAGHATDLAPSIGAVIDRSGGHWTTGAPGVTILTVDTPLFDIAEKQAAREQTGADLADCESAAFAASCDEAGLHWSIIRAISDDWNEPLPRQAEHWITPDGSTRIGRVILDCLVSLNVIAGVLRLSRRSNKALRAAADRLADTLRSGTP